jgi:hypothetical protein
LLDLDRIGWIAQSKPAARRCMGKKNAPGMRERLFVDNLSF